MAQFQIPNPWQAGYATPSYVAAEPPGQREAIVTEQQPRGSYVSPPALWAGGFTNQYAEPPYAEAEPLRRGAAYSVGLARKTVPALVPDYLSGFDTADMPAPGYAGDTIKAYGEQAAAIIMQDLKKAPKEARTQVLTALLSQLEADLPARVSQRTVKYRAAGLDDTAALQAALASSMSEGFAKELIKLGKSGSPSPTGMLGLAGFEGRQAVLAGFWDTVKSVAKKVALPVTAPSLWLSAQSIKLASSTVSKLGGLACKVLSNPASQFAGAAAGAAIGGPAGVQAGAAGASIGAQACAKPAAAVPVQMAPPGILAGMPSWVVPAAIGGVGLIAVILLTRKP